VGAERVTAFAVLDVSFVSDSEGFALGTATCGKARLHCLVVLKTADGARHWTLASQLATHATGDRSCYTPPVSVCVSALRFVTPKVGYAFDPALLMTTDGGRSWQRQPGWVTSLEGDAHDVLRVSTPDQPCNGEPSRLESSAPGGRSWHVIRTLQTGNCPPTLYRQGPSTLAIVDYGNPAGCCPGAVLSVSTDRGAHLTSRAEICTQHNDNSYTAAVAMALGNVLVRLCVGGPTQPYEGQTWLRASADLGRTYTAKRMVAGADQGNPGVQLAAASATRWLAMLDGPHVGTLEISNDAGRHWVAAAMLPPGRRILVGFEDPMTARAAVGNLVYTSRDGGQHWETDHFTPDS
jgi:hypothetical protein